MNKEFCICGRYPKEKNGVLVCPNKHEYVPFSKRGIERKKIGKWSGKSKNEEYGLNWNIKEGGLE